MLDFVNLQIMECHKVHVEKRKKKLVLFNSSLLIRAFLATAAKYYLVLNATVTSLSHMGAGGLIMTVSM